MTSDSSVPGVVTVTLVCDTTASYASYQNAIPLVRTISIENGTTDDLTELEIRLRAEPDFADPITYRLERLTAGNTFKIASIDLKFRHRKLAELNESERGRLVVEVSRAGSIFAGTDFAVELLAYDQWGGTRGIPELLAAFSLPNNPIVDRLLSEAGALLAQTGSGRALTGYQTKNREDVWAQISAIYAAVARRALQYSVPPASFVADGQKIRTPDRIMAGGVATCIDLVMLLSGCLEQAGLNPVVLLKEGHAWIGCWLLNTSFGNATTEDAQSIRKRIDTGEMIAFEATGLTQRPALSLRAATEVGLTRLRDEADKFRVAIDIRRARTERIQPLPSRETVEQGERQVAEPVNPSIEPVPPLPALAGDIVLLDENEQPDTPQGRLNRWKGKLLDLTRRNRLLNFKATRVMVPLKVPDVARLEDALSDGQEWKIRPMTQIMQGADPRSAGIAEARAGQNPVEAMARKAMDNRELLATIDKQKLDSQLYEVYLTVKNNLEEGGANTLYLAIGFLRWTEDEHSEQINLAPILLVPVILNRASIRTGFSIKRHDDEAMVNPTLVQMLKEKYHVELKGIDPLPMDASGVDADRILAIFKQAVKEIPRWEVSEEVYLGVFSFKKYLMWKDLRDRAEDLKKNRVVGHLIDRPREVLDAGTDLSVREDLDDRHPPGTLLAPMLADSSQLNAVARANEGRDFVLEGPPGTGKSQTITNLIAHFLGEGKRVLFVSEKMAALGVVERRLNAIGLGPFCLQLHSEKAKKTEVLAQLRTSLGIASAKSPHEWEIEAEKLQRLRTELNAFVRALHKVHPNGLTVRDALDTAIQFRSWNSIPIELSSIDLLDNRGLAGLLDLAASIQAALIELEPEAFNILSEITTSGWTNSWEEELLESASRLDGAADALEHAASELAGPLGLPLSTASAKLLNDLDALADTLLHACEVPSSFAKAADDTIARHRLAEARAHGSNRNRIWATIADVYKPDVSQLDGAALLAQWHASLTRWWLPRLLSQRAITKTLLPHTLQGRQPSIENLEHTLSALSDLNREDRELAKVEPDMKAVLSEAFHGIQTDWEAVQRFEEWGASLESALTRFTSLEEPKMRSELSACVRRFASEQRELLSPSGALTTALLRYRDRYRMFKDALSKTIELSSNPNLACKDSRAMGYLSRIHGVIQHWRARRAWLKPWCRWRELRQSALASGLTKVIIPLETQIVSVTDTAAYVEYCYRVWWLKGMIDRDPALRSFSRSEHERKIREFRETDERFQKLSERYLYVKLASKLPDAAAPASRKSEMAVLSRELAKQRAHFPVRKLVQHIPNLLPQLKPCLLMSPLSVAQYLDAGHMMFDLVIFDEASQIPVWDAVGAIARGKQVVVVGDPQQLPPTSFFEKADDDEGAFDEVQEDAPIKDLESILDECMATGMSRLSLDWHYRSRHESLIAFSNSRYYDSRLITFPSPVTTDNAVKLHLKSGIYDRGGSRTNNIEATAVVNRILEHFRHPDEAVRKLTMGVVTFNQPQMRLIDQLLQEELLKHHELEDRLSAHGDEKLFIKNLENVQGDERDIILFSVTYGKDQAGRMPMNFGPINQDGGHRRLNVAVTRARAGIEIFSSVRAEDIDLSRTRARGVSDLKAYLDYAVRGARAIAEEALPTGHEPDSPFEQDIIKLLRDAGWTVHPQVGCSGYRIDIGVVDQANPGKYLAGIECDGASYHGLPVARDRDRLRQSILQNLGWSLFRVWSTDWWTNSDKVGKDLLNRLSALQTSSQNETTKT
jgi:very-short-patch-repair endonuclease